VPSGDVRTATIKMENGRSRGMGSVSFFSPEDAKRAVCILAAAAASRWWSWLRPQNGPVFTPSTDD